MKSILLKFIFVLSLAITLFSCKNNDEPAPASPLDGLTKLNEGYVSGASAKLEIWGKKNYFAGYNELILVLYDSLDLTQKITDAHIQFNPLMDMGMMKHACPVENPNTEAVDGVFNGAVVFIMPTTMDGSWKLGVDVHNHKYDKEGSVEFNITVDTPANALIKSFVSQSADSTKLFVTLIQPENPIVGINNCDFAIYKKETMMSFPPVDTYTMEITPEMPSMGHGSPNNVNPVSIGNGHYAGKVNFTMTGEWQINVVINKDGAPVSNNLFFTVVF